MKETGGTETSVKWPSWCYSDKVNCNVIRERSRVEKDFEDNLSRSSKYKCPLTKIQSARDCNTVHRCRTPCAKIPAPTRRVRPAIKILGEKKMLRESSLLLSEYINNNTTHSAKTNCDISDTKALAGVQLPRQGIDPSIANSTTAAAAVAYLYLEKVKNERMSPRVAAAQFDSLKDAIMESSSAAAAVAAALVNNNNNNSNSNNNNHNSNNNNNNISGSGSNCSNSCSNKCNNLVNNQVQNQNVNNSINITSDELLSHSLTLSCNQSQQQQHQLNKQSHNFHHQQQQQQLSFHMNSNHVKKERLSPGTNGDHPTPLSRSRSTTPSSFRGTSPQNSVHSSPSEITVPMHNLSANLLNSIHNAAASTRHGNLRAASPGTGSASTGVPTDFSTRNYSDFMRSLAAKYNNANPNDNIKRNTLFDTPSNATTAQKKSCTPLQKASYATSPPSPHSRDITITTTSSLTSPAPMTSSVSISPSESTIKLSQQNKLAAAVANAAAACSSNNISPYMTSFLNSLQFSPGIFPPLIDMSSTQALITLARAAKEHEIQHILSASPQNMKRSATNAQPTPSPSLSMALQQAAQFISPALIYSAQLQKDQVQLQQQHQQQQQLQPQVARQSSPCLANISSSAASSKSSRNHGKKLNVSPLDLSSQPTAIKRFKPESSSSQSSTDALLQTAIIRRSSSSTATTSPSPPPPLNEKSFIASAIAVPTHAVTPSVVLGSSSQTEATLTTFKPIKISSSTSTKSSIAPAVTVRQCQGQSEELNSWTVDDVCAFVSSIDICSEYAKHFRDQCIDGSGLPLLTEDHLVNSLGMKLGPALKLRSVLAKKLGGPCPCVTCVAQVQQMLALQTSGMTSTSTAITSEHTPANDTTNATACDGSIKSSSNCNIVLPKNLLSSNSSISCNSNNSSNNSPVNSNEAATTCSAISVNICNTDETATNITRSSNNSNINVGNFSAPQPQTPAATTAQQYHFNQQQQKSPPPSANRHDNTESSS